MHTIATEIDSAPSTPKNVTFVKTKPPSCLGAAVQLQPAQHAYAGQRSGAPVTRAGRRVPRGHDATLGAD